MTTAERIALHEELASAYRTLARLRAQSDDAEVARFHQERAQALANAHTRHEDALRDTLPRRELLPVAARGDA